MAVGTPICTVPRGNKEASSDQESRNCLWQLKRSSMSCSSIKSAENPRRDCSDRVPGGCGGDGGLQ